MKRFLALFLALVMVFGMVPALGTTAKAETDATTEVTTKPFYGLAWDTVEMSLFGNIEDAPTMIVSQSNGVVSLSGSAATMKTKLDALPEGMRYIRIFKTAEALRAGAEYVVYADNGMNQLKALMTEFIEEYYALGGQLDGIILDTEYTAMGSWYIYSDTYGGYYEPSAEKIEANGLNRNIYNDIVNHPNYATDIRPLLEERGFAFYDNVSGNKSEIWSMFPPQIWSSFSSAERTKFNTYYTNCYSIWNRVMYNRIAAYLTDAVYNPMAARYPNATVSDYTVTDTATWENYMSEGGSVGAMVGNADKVGNTSNENMYNSNPNSGFFADGDTYLYNNILSHNEAVYDDDAYGSLMFNVNRFKSMYAATDTKKISAWIAEYDYSGRSNSVKNSPYYTEFMYHLGLLDPLPFLIYMYTGSSKFSGTAGKVKYNECLEVISQILDELTRVAGYSDRKPIETPQSWNDGFMLSGMYANGRNIWRLTPDTTDGKTLADFKVTGTTNPTFSINGNTITFPGGTILTDATISTVGSCGYWIETAADVQPVITREEDRYVEYPSFGEDFEDFASGDVFNSPDTVPMQVWDNDTAMITSTVSLTGTASQSFTIPDAVASSTTQSWEMKFTIPYSNSTKDEVTTEVALTETAEMVFLTYGTDGGIKIVNNQVYYDSNGSYVLLDGVTLTPGSAYRVRRVVDLDASTCDYVIYKSNGTFVAEVKNVPMKAVSGTVTTLGASVSNFQAITTQTDSDGNITTTTADAKLNITAAAANIPLLVEEYDGDKALALTGTVTLNNVKLPKNITAGDSYAMKQAWELSFTLSEALSAGNVTLFNGAVKLESGKLYYNAGGSYVALADITAGTKYTINVNNNFTNNTATYTLSADGAEVAKAADIAVEAVTLPVETISMAATGVTAKVYIDDYKLYPTGLEYGIKFYDGDTGIIQSATEQLTNEKVAYRLSWMNATSGEAKGQIYVDRHDGNDAEVLKTIDMQPGWDGVETGVLENTTGKLTVYLKVCEKANTTLEGAVEAGCTTEGYTGDLICNDCGEIYEQGTVIAAGNHKVVTITGKKATCTETGLTDGKYCSVCNEVLAEQEVIPAKGHTENVVKAGYAATCTTAGKTDLIRCATCGVLLQSQVEIPALGHAAGDPVQENVVANSCTEAGSYDLVVYCTREGCGEEISRETVTVEAVGHTEAEPVKENETTTSYDLVVYCSGCNAELSRETVTFVSATVTLWGTKVTIDTDESDDENPEVYYWVNGAEGEAPVAATAEDAWNYRFAIIDGVPTVTIRNAEYSYAASFLVSDQVFDGKLKLAYEGTNNMVVPYSSSATYRFAYYASVTNSSGAGHLYIVGEEDAVLNVTGGDNSAAMIGTSRRANLTISGGTLKVHKTNAGGVNGVIVASYGNTVIENCTLDVKIVDGVGGKHPAVTTYALTIRDSDVTINTNAHTGLCAGVFQSNMKGVLYSQPVTIEGDSNINIITDSNSTSDYAYNGVGIYASKLTVKGGNLEVDAKKQAVYLTATDAIPDLTSYDGDYEMYTAKDSEAVTEYTATTYFKVKYLCPHPNTTTTETVVEPTCTEAGSRTVTVTCECGEVISTTTEEIPALGHTEEVVPGTAATCLETGLTDGRVCSVCGEVLVAQEEIPATGHTEADPVKENLTDTTYERVVYCAVCGVELSRESITVSSATVTLFGTSVTIDDNDLTADVPEALYWVNGGEGEAPVAATAADDWNYSFEIIDGIPTVTLRNADYKYSKSVVYGKYDGKFRLAYEGINNVFIPSHSSEGRYFLSFSASTNGISSARRVYITGAENAVLNITGGDNSASMISTSNKVYVEVSGGTLNVEKTTAGGVNPVVSFSYCPVTIKNTTLSVINNTKVTGQRPAIVGGYSGYYFNVDDANLYVESWANIGICAGVWNVNGTIDGVKVGGVDSPTVFDVTGKSDIKVVNTYSGTHPYAGTGIYASQVKMTGGNLEAQGTSLGLRLTNATPLNLGSYNGEYKMFTEKDAAAVTAYTATTYFKIERACEHVEQIIPGKAATCTMAGVTEGSKCSVCGKIFTAQTVIPAPGHTVVILPSQELTCTQDGKTEGSKCETCGEILVAQVVTPATGHTYDDVTDIYCNTCGAARPTITVEGNTVSVHLNGVASAKTHTFYVEGKEIADINDWAELKATGTLKSYAIYEFVLATEGDYVLRLEYVDSEGVRDVTSYPVTIENADDTLAPACKPEFTIKDNIVRVKYNGATNMKVHAFYVEGKEVSDISFWSALKAADPNFKTYSKDIMPLTRVGRHILRAEYTDSDGKRCTESFEVYVERVPLSVTVVQKNVTVNIDGATNVKVHAFLVEEGESVSNIYDWSLLVAVDPEFRTYTKDTFRLREYGRYVLRVEYIDPDGVRQAISFMAITSLIVPEVTVSGNKIKLTTNGLTVNKLHVFYVEGQDIADINDWNELKSEAVSYKAYSKAPFTVNNSGAYVIRIEFVDRTGAVNKVSQLVNIES